jgi:hypothetical protein
MVTIRSVGTIRSLLPKSVTSQDMVGLQRLNGCGWAEMELAILEPA